MTDFRFVSDVASASNFALAGSDGVATDGSAGGADCGVRPLICVG